ncbi:hypothetical protein ACFLQU_01900 [Verrucomicrobiota bacterium]
MRNVILSAAVLICLVISGCFKPVEPEPEPLPRELPKEIVFATSNLPPPVVIEDETLQTAKNSVVADFNLDGLDDVAIVEEVEEEPPSTEPGKPAVAPLSVRPPEVTVYIKAKPRKDGGAIQKNLYHKAGAIPSVLGRTVKGIASRKTVKYTDLVILLKEDDGSTEMVHYQNKGDRFVKIEAVQTEMPE